MRLRELLPWEMWFAHSLLHSGRQVPLGYRHMLAIFSVLSGIFLLLRQPDHQGQPEESEEPLHGLDAGHEALRCFTSMLFWVYAWPESMLEILKPARVVYYTMSLQLFFSTWRGDLLQREKGPRVSRTRSIPRPLPSSSVVLEHGPCHQLPERWDGRRHR